MVTLLLIQLTSSCILLLVFFFFRCTQSLFVQLYLFHSMPSFSDYSFFFTSIVMCLTCIFIVTSLSLLTKSWYLLLHFLDTVDNKLYGAEVEP